MAADRATPVRSASSIGAARPDETDRVIAALDEVFDAVAGVACALITEQAREGVDELVRDAVSRGATVLTGVSMQQAPGGVGLRRVFYSVHVDAAASLARPGDVVLLAPGCGGASTTPGAALEGERGS